MNAELMCRAFLTIALASVIDLDCVAVFIYMVGFYVVNLGLEFCV